VLQRVAVLLQCVAGCRSFLQRDAVCCSVLQCVAACVAACCSAQVDIQKSQLATKCTRRNAACCSGLQRVAACCSAQTDIHKSQLVPKCSVHLKVRNSQKSALQSVYIVNRVMS